MTSRVSDKNLKGLQGTAATTIIARGVYDAYYKWKDETSNSSGSYPENNKTNQEIKKKCLY